MQNKSGIYTVLLLMWVITACQKEPVLNERDFKALGTAARDLLAADNYTALRVEINYMPGVKPDETSVNNLMAFLNTYLHKPGGIQITQYGIPASGKEKLSLQEVVELERKYRTSFTRGHTISVYILLTDGFHTGNIKTLATSYWNTSVCIFGGKMQELLHSGGQAGAIKLLSTLLQHEFGHLLGLVDQGTPMQVPHKDAANGAHCNNRTCLMYHGIEAGSILGTSLSALPTLDARCIADLKANGGK